MSHRSIEKAAVIAALCVPCLDAAAQVSIAEVDGLQAVVGLAVGAAPDYKGSDDYAGIIAPFARYVFPGTTRYVQLNATELSLNLANHPRYRFGPVLNYHVGRDDNVDDKAVKRMEEIDDTVEAGVFGEMVWTEPGRPRNRFILGATVLADVGSEHDGLRARLNARSWRQVSQRWDLHFGGGVIFGDNKYNSRYFEVTRSNVNDSGLPLYKADSGINEAYVSVGGLAYLNKNWIALVGVRVGFMAGDAKDSPVVDRRGDSTQVIGAIGIGYMWR
jgi:MipA family protein